MMNIPATTFLLRVGPLSRPRTGGAGDSVTANLAAALAAGATVREAIEIANVAASIVIHQLGTTGTARDQQIADLLPKE
jgi:bifunctional ADP-heptose synthase (sugar kinase/adenylyltransferase)